MCGKLGHSFLGEPRCKRHGAFRLLSTLAGQAGVRRASQARLVRDGNGTSLRGCARRSESIRVFQACVLVAVSAFLAACGAPRLEREPGSGVQGRPRIPVEQGLTPCGPQLSSNAPRVLADGWEPTWSPDCSRIAYSLVGGVGQPDGIYVMDSDGSNQTRISEKPSIDHVWSPDGRRIAFCYCGPRPEIWIVDADGRNETRLTTDGFSPVWSPDGSQIAFISTRLNRLAGELLTGDLFVMDAKGGSQRQLADIHRPHAAAWAPDGTKIAFAGGSHREQEIYVVDANGQNLEQLTNTGVADQPSWSPDGNKLAFTSGPDFESVVHTMEADGRNVKSLAAQGVDNDMPAWSPEGSAIAFLARDASDILYLFTVDDDGANPRELAANVWPDTPAWSPDGTKITFTSAEREQEGRVTVMVVAYNR